MTIAPAKTTPPKRKKKGLTKAEKLRRALAHVGDARLDGKPLRSEGPLMARIKAELAKENGKH